MRIHRQHEDKEHIMATKLLPITEITLPNDEWEMQSFKENRAFSEETTCFTAVLVHKPTKYKMHVRNDGRGGSHFIDGDYQHPKHAEVQAKWKQFVLDSLPALRESIKDSMFDYKADWYLTPSHMDDESVVDLFVVEMQNQQDLSRKRGVIVRKPDGEKGTFVQYMKATPEALAGKVQGEFWDKKTKNWVAL
jgi:hypothetical protein